MSKKVTTIYDYFGSPLRLEETRLIEVHRSANTWMASYANIRKAYKSKKSTSTALTDIPLIEDIRDTILIEETEWVKSKPRKKTGFRIRVGFYLPGYLGSLGVIGCRHFTRRTFNLILKAAGVIVTKKKALAAKAGR